MEIFTMECFICAADLENLSKAADRMCISQPALSMQIKKLEKNLNTKLINRNSRFPFLTDEGKLVYQSFVSILGTYRNLEWQLSQRQNSSKILRVGYHGPTFWANLPDFLSDFMLEHPNVRIDVTVTELGGLNRMLESGEIDIAFMLDHERTLLQHSGIESIELFRELGCFGMSPSHPLAGRSMIHTEDLLGQKIYMNSGGKVLESYEPFEHANISPKNIVFADGYIATVSNALANNAIVIMPRSFKQERKNIVYVDHDIDALSVSFFAVCRKDNLTGLTEAFLHACRKHEWPKF